MWPQEPYSLVLGLVVAEVDAVSSPPWRVLVSVSEDTLRLEGMGLGPAQVTVEASNTYGSAQQTFDVAVVPVSAPPNEWPELLRCPNTQIIPLETHVSWDMSAFFRDPDGDALTFSAESQSPDAVAVSVSGSTIWLENKSGATTLVRIVAADPGGLFGSAEFFVLRAGVPWWGRPAC